MYSVTVFHHGKRSQGLQFGQNINQKAVANVGQEFSNLNDDFCMNKKLLVGGLEHFLFSHILGIPSSQLTNLFQRGSNHQPD